MRRACFAACRFVSGPCSEDSPRRKNLFSVLLDMNSLQHFPLGAVWPNSPHAVVCSLPTMADVCGYEEKDARVLQAMTSGYPRFVRHPYVRELIAWCLEREALPGRAGVLVSGTHFSAAICESIEQPVAVLEVEPGMYLLHYDAADSELARKVRLYVQHVGCGISSRQAEDLLVRERRLSVAHAEPTFEGDAQAEVTRCFAELCGALPTDIRICASGMSAFYAAFSAVQRVQRSRGRMQWLQLGWLYLDSGCILQSFLEGDESLEICYDIKEVDALIEKIVACGDELAGVVVECPTNPLIQVADLARVSEAVRVAGGVLIVDPSIASVYNVDVLRYGDILVNSLTKYAAYEGDVMIGALALNSGSPLYADLSAAVSAFCLAPYSRDLARLAFEMQTAPQAVAQMNANAARLAVFLRAHPVVKQVHFAADYPNYSKLAKSPACCGAMITVELNVAMEPFYDAIRCLKGPSFGTQFTLIAPFMYLAHYDLVTTAKGRDFLGQLQIDPELIRISVGIEPYAEIEAVFSAALDDM
jgi:cystathionine gamma-synthase